MEEINKAEEKEIKDGYSSGPLLVEEGGSIVMPEEIMEFLGIPGGGNVSFERTDDETALFIIRKA